MSASCSSESSESKIETSQETNNSSNSRYALYLFSNNKHAGTSDNISERNESVVYGRKESKSDLDEPSFCLSLLEGNLGAEQETVVRCYLLKTLSAREDLSFENEGKYAVLHFSDKSEVPFGCYYHRLSKHSSNVEDNDPTQDITSSEPSKVHTFFICLIGPSSGIMESFCQELGVFCQSLIPLLDHEGQTNHVQLKLKKWYFFCIEYISRCVQNFKEDLAIVFQSSLWGNVEIISEEQSIKWDLERLVDTCSLMPKNINAVKDMSSILDSFYTITVADGKISTDKSLESFPFCRRWCDKLNNCLPNDHAQLHSVLEGFRLKAIQDLNTLKRLLQKAETDHYSLYKAYQFLQASGYENILLYHVKHEANVTGEEEALEIISCLQECLKNKKSSPVQKVTGFAVF